MRSPCSAALALGALVLAACGEDITTEPSPATDANPTAPELAPASNSWITRANMPSSRTDLATATVTNGAGQSIVYAIGGLNPNRVPIAKVTAYNAATNSWIFSPPAACPAGRDQRRGGHQRKDLCLGGVFRRRR